MSDSLFQTFTADGENFGNSENLGNAVESEFGDELQTAAVREHDEFDDVSVDSSGGESEPEGEDLGDHDTDNEDNADENVDNEGDGDNNVEGEAGNEDNGGEINGDAESEEEDEGRPSNPKRKAEKITTSNKRGRGRPPKKQKSDDGSSKPTTGISSDSPKRGRGRPPTKKVVK